MIEGYRRGDPEAVRAVYREFGRLVYVIALRIVGSTTLAQEVTQETIVKAWRAAERFDAGCELGPWLATIARRTAIDTRRREARRPEVAELDEARTASDVDPAFERAEQSDEAWAVRAAIDQLPADERDVIRLQHLEGLTQTEVADRLGVAIGTVKSRSYRAHRRLAAALGHLREGIAVIREPRSGRRRRERAGPFMTTDDDRISYLAGEPDGAVDEPDERARLDDLRRLLAEPAMWDEPPPGLEGDVVSVVSPATGRPRSAAVAPAPARSADVARHRRWARPLPVAAAVDEPLAMDVRATQRYPDAAGTARFTETTSGWRIELDVGGLPRRDDGEFYEAWLKDDDDVLVSIGTFNDGRDVVLWAGVSPISFRTLTITEEVADGDPTSSGRRVLVGTLDADD